MGLFRKMASLSTMGAVDYRSDKERAARYNRTAAQEVRRMRQAVERRQADAHPRLAAPAKPGKASAPSRPAPVPAAPSTADELGKLADLRNRGVLTPEEFVAQKARLLGYPVPVSPASRPNRCLACNTPLLASDSGCPVCLGVRPSK